MNRLPAHATLMPWSDLDGALNSDMDLSYAAAYKLGFAQAGAATAEVEAILFQEPADPPATFQATAEPSGIFLQLGAFGSSANAESFRDKIQPQASELRLTARSAFNPFALPQLQRFQCPASL